MELIKKHALFFVSLILLTHFVLSLVVSSQESMTYDERAHIPAAYSYVRYGDMRLNPEHPPLIKDLSGLFLLPLNLDFPIEADAWQTGYNEQWLMGDMFINCSRPELACNDADTILFFSRLPIIILSVLLGLGLFWWTRELGGVLAGLIAVTLYAFDPNIIAHNHYVTTDLGSAGFIFLAFYGFVRFLKNPTPQTMLLAGVTLGLAQLTKFSALLVLPVFGLFVVLYALTQVTDSWRNRFRSLWFYALRFTGVVTVCFVLVWIGYAINTSGMPAIKVAEHADLFLSQPNTPARISHDAITWMTHSPILLPMAEYLVGVAKVFSRVAAGNVHYYLGTVSVDAQKSYFPVVFLLKSTLPFLFLLLVTALYTFYRFRHALRDRALGLGAFLAHSFHSRIVQYLSVFFVLFYTYISITGNLTIGLRHLFPIFPFLYLLVALALANLYKRHQSEPVTHQLLGIMLGLVMFSVIAIPVISYPSYLSYFNVAAGGHTMGYHYVTDSNYDWGQDLKYLKMFVETQNNCKAGTAPLGTDCTLGTYPAIDSLRVDYFGGSDPRYYLGDAFIPWWGSKRPIETGWYAISTFFYQESLYKTLAPGEENYAWLKEKTPLARAGDSFLIYYIEGDKR
ncbi:MAG: phospholipid carrier-dependent glycosyltransferase [Candidatus Moraniibacteriota bacterium]|nr:MAG: phospholipid carrier-dependent glycosyltransferase [Candidatus Moranbacteria bacterium]